MSDTTEDLQRKLARAMELQTVVRTMKAMAASSITQYQNSTRALVDYFRSIELGLGACLREMKTPRRILNSRPNTEHLTAIVFGTDQGLVGQFNEVIADHAQKELAPYRDKTRLWTVGERIHSRLNDLKMPISEVFLVPNSIDGITALVGDILLRCKDLNEDSTLLLIYNEVHSGSAYAPVVKRLLPIDEKWREEMMKIAWPSKRLPQILDEQSLTALIREYLFISIFRACTESLAAENASRLAAMQRAEKNIQDLIEDLSGSFNNLRQSRIDEELFDVISGFETISKF